MAKRVDRDQLEAIVTDVQGWIAQFPEIEQLLAERARYREALERIAAMYAPGAFGIQPVIDHAVAVARVALDGESTDEQA